MSEDEYDVEALAQEIFEQKLDPAVEDIGASLDEHEKPALKLAIKWLAEKYGLEVTDPEDG